MSWLRPAAVLAVPGAAVPVAATPVRAPRLLFWNAPLAGALGLPAEAPADAAAWFAGNAVPPDGAPVALAYAGHQFGHFVPQLGDGRALLLGDARTREGAPVEVQLKGSGPTPFSRNGDGRAALGPVLREVLVSEGMHALGIPSTRALAAVATGEHVLRDAVKPGAVLARVAASHVRVGTFQYFAVRGDTAAVRALADFTIARHYPALATRDDRYPGLLDAVAARTAALVAAWLHVGFVHGVMNTDNLALSGETIDYGPCAFLDAFDRAKVFSSIDRHGRYAYAHQPAVAQWNLARLAECLLPLLAPDEERALAMANEVIGAFPGVFEAAWLAGLRRKLGLATEDADDLALGRTFLDALQAAQLDHTLAWRGLADLLAPVPADRRPALDLANVPALADWRPRWRARLAQEARPEDEVAAALRAASPAVIPRNHRVEAALAAAEAGDLAPFGALLAALRRPFDDGPAQHAFMAPPAPGEEVRQTFCGT